MAKYKHFANLVVQYRKDLGYRTSRRFHSQLQDPPVEYQSWTHIESGRRLPKPETVMAIAQCLGIPPREAIQAYTKDMFQNVEDEALSGWGASSGNDSPEQTLTQAAQLKTDWHELSDPQWRALQRDPRLFHTITAPFPREKLSVGDLSRLTGMAEAEAQSVVQQLLNLGLLIADDGRIYKKYRGVKIPRTGEALVFRKDMMIHRINRTMTPLTEHQSLTVNLTDEDRDEIVALYHLIEAKCLLGHERAKAKSGARTYGVITYLTPLGQMDVHWEPPPIQRTTKKD